MEEVFPGIIKKPLKSSVFLLSNHIYSIYKNVCVYTLVTMSNYLYVLSLKQSRSTKSFHYFIMSDVCETVLIFVLICQDLGLDPKTPPEHILPLVNASI